MQLQKILKKSVAYFLDENALLMFGEVRAKYFVDSNSYSTTNESKSNGNYYFFAKTNKLILITIVFIFIIFTFLESNEIAVEKQIRNDDPPLLTLANKVKKKKLFFSFIWFLIYLLFSG